MIRLEQVSKAVKSGAERLTILHPLYLQIPAGQFVAVVGPSGSGKSTLLSLIAGLDKPTTGNIRLAGEWLGDLHENELARLRRAKVGFIFQSFQLIPTLTAYENILIPMEMDGIPHARERAQALLDEVGLHERGHHYPSQLSGGMQQRAAIARALAIQPKLLLMDEPFGALDEMTRERMNMELHKIWQQTQTTVIFVTHSIAEAVFLSTRVVVMSARPGEIMHITNVNLPVPRGEQTREEPAYFACETEVREWLRKA